jgi:glycine betaine transporter
MLVIIAMCVALMKALRAEPYESSLPSRVRRAVQYVKRQNMQEQHAVALTSLGADHHKILPDAREDGSDR